MSIKNILCLAIALSTLFISCIPSNKTVGDQFIPGDYILKTDTASFNLNITNKKPDSVQARSSSFMIIGNLLDPVFGATNSSAVVQVLPTSDSTDFGDSPQIKSVSLNLVVNRYANANYSDEYEGIAQNIYIYKLKKTIDSTRLFNNSYTKDSYDPTPIHLGAPVYYGGDTIGITLSNDFGKELLKTTLAEFEQDYHQDFTERIKGLYITTDTPDLLKEGGRLNYLPLRSSYIRLNYYLTDIDKGFDKRDTSEIFVVGYYFALNQIKSGSESLESDVLEDKLYIDGLAGVKPYLNGAELKAQLDNWLKAEGHTKESIILSRASIDLPFEMPTDYTKIDKRFPKFIYPCTIDPESKDLMPLEEINYIYNFTVDENINRSLLTYSSDITRYAQELIKKDITEIDSSYDLWFSPILYTVTSTDNYDNPTGSSRTFNLQKYCNGTLNGSLAKRNPTLSLVFSVIP